MGGGGISYSWHDLWSICWKAMETSSNCSLRWEFVSNSLIWTQLNIFSHFTLRQSLRVQTHTHLQQWQKSHWLHWEQDKTHFLKVLQHNYSRFFKSIHETEEWGLLLGFFKIKLAEKMKLGFFYTSSDVDLNSLVWVPRAQHQSVQPMIYVTRPHGNLGSFYILKSHF